MNNISRVKIGDIGKTITGKTPSSSNPEDFGAKYMFVTPSDSFDKKIMNSTERFLSEEGAKKLSKKLLPPKSVMITCIGSAMGKVSMNETSCVTNQQINSIVPNNHFDPDYIYYAIKNNYKVLRNAATGSTALPLLNKTDFDILEIPLHKDKIYQQKISSVLSPLDAKIELNNKVNRELEGMAKTLYDYWFVQFDFPDANGRPYKSSGGKMVYNAELKREIPEGWEVKELGKLIDIQRGISYKSSDISGGGIPMISLNSFNLDGTYKAGGIKTYSGRYTDNQIAKSDDLLIAATDVTRNADIIGKAIMVPHYYKNDLVFSMDIAKIIPKKEISSPYLMMLFNSDHYHNYIKWYASGTIVLHLNMDGVKWYKAEIPPTDLIEKFDSFYLPIANRINETERQNEQLTALRDWLLPMLMNGQVTVKEAEEKLSMAAEPSVKYGN
jgi:type I restriction enzyme, S subunit